MLNSVENQIQIIESLEDKYNKTKFATTDK